MNARALIIAMAVLAAAPALGAGPLYLPGPMPLQPAPAAPTAPRFEPAPVPSQDVTLPRPPPPVPGEPEFSTGLSNPTLPLRSGEGYTKGSNFSPEVQRRSRSGLGPGITPGFAITVPLDK